MKAIQITQYGNEDQFQLVDLPKPTPAQGQLVVRIFATSLNPIDPKRTSGNMRQIFPIQFPFIPGGDFSGVVDSVAQDVQGYKPGDEVFGYSTTEGTYAEYVAVDTNHVAPKPKTLNHVESASLVLVAQTAQQLLDLSGAQQGQTVLIHGAGGAVGGVAVQLAHHRGIKVIATASAASLDRLRQYGADEVIDYKNTPFDKIVHGVDAVLDAVGGDVQQRSFSVLRPGGILVSAVHPPSEQEAASHHVKAAMVFTQVTAATVRQVAELIDAGVIKPYVAKVYPLSEAAKAWRESRTHHVDGKIVLQPAAEAHQDQSSAKSAESATSRSASSSS